MDAGLVLTLALVVFSSVVGYLIGKRSARPSAAAGSYLALYNGVEWQGFNAKRAPGGIEANGVTYPESAVTPLVLGAGLVVYFAGIERVALSTHQALENGRAGIMFAHMWNGGGDMNRLAQLAASVVPILVAIYIGVTFASLGGQISSTQVGVQQVLVTMREGLQCKV